MSSAFKRTSTNFFGQNEDKFLNVNDFKKFAAAAEENKGQPVSDLIIQTPPSQDGALSEAYWEEEAKFQEVMKKTFKDLIVSLLLSWQSGLQYQIKVLVVKSSDCGFWSRSCP